MKPALVFVLLAIAGCAKEGSRVMPMQQSAPAKSSAPVVALETATFALG